MSRVSRILCWGIPLFIGASLAAAWVASGGFFAPGHDAYGVVPVPGELVVTLPAGPARLYVEEHKRFRKNEQASIPDDLLVSVQPVSGGPALTLHSNTHAAAVGTDTESWNTFAAFDVPTAGDYRVTVATPGDRTYPRHTLTIGKGPWAPVPPWVFAIGILLVATGVGFVGDRILAS